MIPSAFRKYLVFALVWAGVVAWLAGLPARRIAAEAPPGAYYCGGVQNLEDACFYISQLADGGQGRLLLPNRMTPEERGPGEFRPFFTLGGLFGQALGLSPTGTYRLLSYLGSFLFALAFSLLAGWLLGWNRAAMLASLLAATAAGPLSLLPGDWQESLAGTYGILAAEEAMAESNSGRALAAAGPLFSFSLGLQVVVLGSWGWALSGARGALPLLALTTLALGFIHPYDLPPLCLAAACLLSSSFLRPSPNGRTPFLSAERSAAMVLLAGAAPALLYRLWLLRYDPDFAAYYTRIFLNSPNPFTYVLAGAPFCFFLPWAARGTPEARRPAVRMLLFWVVAVVVCLYLPMRIQRRMVEGLHGIVVLLGVAGMAWFWTHRRAWQRRPLPVLIALLVGFALLAGLLPNARYPFAVAQRAAAEPERYFLSRSERSALAFAAQTLPPGQVLAGSRGLGPYIPALTPHRAFLAHYHQTLGLPEKSRVLERILDPRTLPEERAHLLLASPITHLVFGPREAATTSWRPEREAGLREIYATPEGDARVYAVQGRQ